MPSLEFGTPPDPANLLSEQLNIRDFAIADRVNIYAAFVRRACGLHQNSKVNEQSYREIANLAYDAAAEIRLRCQIAPAEDVRTILAWTHDQHTRILEVLALHPQSDALDFDIDEMKRQQGELRRHAGISSAQTQADPVPTVVVDA